MAAQQAQFYRQIIEQSRDGILIIGLDGRILEANQAAQQLYGYSAADFQSLSVMQLRLPQEHTVVPVQMQAAQQSGLLFRTRHIKKDGSVFHAEVRSQGVSTADGLLLVSVIRDISQLVLQEEKRHRQEAELRQSHHQLNEAYEELTATHEELTASEEELRMQLEVLSERESKIQRQNELLEALQQSAVEIMQRLNVSSLVKDILRRATRLVGTQHGFVYEMDDRCRVFRRILGVGLYKRDLGREIPCDQGIVGLVYKSGKAVIINNYQQFLKGSPESFKNSKLQSVLQIPIFLQGRLQGTIGLAYLEKDRCFTQEDVGVLERFGVLASVALKQAGLMESYRMEISTKEAAVRALHQAQADNQAMLTALPDQVFVLNREGRFLDFRSPARSLLYKNPEFFLGRTLREVFPEPLAEKAMQCIRCIQSPADLQVLEYELPMNDRRFHYEARMVACGEEKIMVIVRDITERVLLEAQLEHLSLHDALTGIYNRAFFEEQMRRLDLQHTAATGLLVCDVDVLNMINDYLGHYAGDRMLIVVAQLLQTVFDEADFIARIGGDEFAVLMEVSAARSLQTMTERLQRKMADYNERHPELPVSLSVGFAHKRTDWDMRSVFKEADNNMYREKLHQQSSARSAIVRALLKALEARDFITEGHVDRLKDIMQAFAGELALPENKVADICLLAQFHDIGKVGIPDNVLFKAGPLDEGEWEIMRRHCEIGYRIARSAPDLTPIAEWILKHHEWWDGRGYPTGLAGETIPLPCRMLAIADAFDAMISDRPYRRAMSVKQALAEIERCAGKQFDPELARAFIGLQSKKA